MSEQNSPPEPEGNGPNPWVKSLMIWGGIFLALLMVVSFFGGSSSGNGTQLLYSDFCDKVAEGSVANVQISETQIVGEMKNGEQFSTIPVANDTSLPQLLEDNGVRYSGAEADNGNILLYALIQILPFVTGKQVLDDVLARTEAFEPDTAGKTFLGPMLVNGAEQGNSNGR